jgi:orotidine-5'-phosphate decarboxylase
MNKSHLIDAITHQKSFLSIGLDPDLDKLPEGISKDAKGVLAFCKKIIEHTAPYCCSYKLNTAFFEVLGPEGMHVFNELVQYIPNSHFVIADAKRGDIGNTSRMYAQTFFETYHCDGLTVSPYMGSDSLKPFLEFKDKYTIVLGLTSNEGAQDFELQNLENQTKVYQYVIKTVASWGTPQNVMFVIGATQETLQKEIRSHYPEHFFLVPGVGAQGGSLEATCQNMLTKDFGILIASSRDILYADSGPEFYLKSAEKAKAISQNMWQLYSEQF